MRTDGALDPPSLARFERFALSRSQAPLQGIPEGALAAAVELYRRGDALFVCGERPCAKTGGFDGTPAALERVRRRVQMPVFVTGCQGHCKHKPVVSLRIEGRRELFGRLASAEDWNELFEHAGAAHALGSTLLPGSRVEPFRFDLEHGVGPANHLPATRFLAGRFRGTGSYVDTPYTFYKEVVGAYEPGGRFLTLHMEARYPSEHGTDLHRALVVVGAVFDARPRLLGRAFTDGGELLEYDVDASGGRLAFTDRSPNHADSYQAVRKVLTPTPGGYDEHLLVDRGNGLVPYYRVALRRVSANDASALPADRQACSSVATRGPRRG